ncbi:hypothetical protein E4631_23895 [Hymenobacter sp. UV11]|uniref:hypothetical protein n=1 Tax=Hymenobacter sp. UV11 TaxID=1849735 RepID=UPI0010616072|nr:hypothetical protein [Hymenobacter sp. UV11]TDN38595.1 hypothetical protein A8B98_22890 [Hymenobacter sp. UV11]TFZ62973.1 hypothetical protein E4631_23895 [Hymenobacter sp. UV11]
MADKVDGRGQHPNSRKALVPGGKANVRVVLTKDFVRRQMEWLSDNEEEFRFMLSQLPPKEYVAAYLKLMDLLIPKKQDVTLSEGLPAEVFQINFGAPDPEQLLALQEAQNTLDISPESEDEPLDFDNLYHLPQGDENSAHDE